MAEPKFQSLQLIIFYHNYLLAAGVLIGLLLDSSFLGGTRIYDNYSHDSFHAVQGALRTLFYWITFTLANYLWENFFKLQSSSFLWIGKLWVLFTIVFFFTVTKYIFKSTRLIEETPLPYKDLESLQMNEI
jgi:hypothetical protein